MIDGEILLWIGLGFLALAVVVGATWLLVAAWSTTSRGRFERRRPAVLAVLAGALQGVDPDGATAALARLNAEQRIELLVEMAFTVAGSQRRRVDELARTSGVMLRADRWAGSRRWARRLRAARLVALFGRDDEPAGELLLNDPNPDVRAQAAEWAGEHPTPERIGRLAEMLADPSPRCRFYAREALVVAGRATLPELRARLDDGGIARPGSAAALEIATALAMPEFVVPGLRSMSSSDPAVRARGASLVAAVGGPEAPRGLALLLSDPSTEVRGAAARGLGRLGHWQAAAAVAALLEEPDWRTRRSAAQALGRMGATGELLLRQAARATNSAGDTAKHVLELEPGAEEAAEPPRASEVPA